MLKVDAACSVFRISLRNQVWRGSAGEFSGNGVGCSMDFHDQRLYAPGDDPRHINWNAYARSGNYSMKLYREEIRPLCNLIIDTSNSSALNAAKQQAHWFCALFCLKSLLSQAVEVRIFAVEGPNVTRLDKQQLLSRQQFEAKLQSSSARQPLVPQLHSLPLRANSMNIFVSDLLYDAEPAAVLQPLLAAHMHSVVIAPYSSQESDPDWSGHLDFVDMESSHKQAAYIDSGLLQAYRKAYQAHFALYEQYLSKHRLRLLRLHAESNFIESLQHGWLKHNFIEALS